MSVKNLTFINREPPYISNLRIDNGFDFLNDGILINGVLQHYLDGFMRNVAIEGYGT